VKTGLSLAFLEHKQKAAAKPAAKKDKGENDTIGEIDFNASKLA
jgi:hypothetical protein